jgi:tRNA-binding protein
MTSLNEYRFFAIVGLSMTFRSTAHSYVLPQLAKPGVAKSFTPAPLKEAVAASILEQLDIRVGEIVAVDDVPQSKKLVKLRVDIGSEIRTIVAGLKTERPDLTVLIGRQALFVVNLEPRRMAGELSEGMLFDLGYADGITPVLAIPEQRVPNGTRAG